MARIDFDQLTLDAFCRKHGLRKLSFFGSVLRDDFRPDSDVDDVLRGAEVRYAEG